MDGMDHLQGPHKRYCGSGLKSLRPNVYSEGAFRGSQTHYQAQD